MATRNVKKRPAAKSSAYKHYMAQKTMRYSGYQRNRSSVPASLTANLSSSELKALDVSLATAAPGGAVLNFNSTGSIIPLNLVRVGSSFFNRIARRLEMKSLDISILPGSLQVTRSAQEDLLRILVVYDRQTNGALPSISDILQDTEQSGTNTTVAYSGINLNNRDRFSIIMDKRIMLPGATATAGAITNPWPNSYGGVTGDKVGIGMIREYRKLKGLLTQYKADSSPAVIGDIATGGLYLITYSTYTAGSEIWAGVDWTCRLRYHDT